MVTEGKARLIEAAKRVIGRNGIAGATMRVIAEEAGLSTGAIYHHYATKEEVLYDVMASTLAEIRHPGEAAQRDGLGRDAILEDISLDIRSRFDRADENRIQFHLAQEAMLGDEELRSKFRDKYEEWVFRTEELMTQLHGPGSRRYRRALATLLLGAIDGTQLQLLIGANLCPPDDMAAVFRRLLSRCLPTILAQMEELEAEDRAREERSGPPQGGLADERRKGAE